MFHLVVTCVGTKSLEGPCINDIIKGLLLNGNFNNINQLFDEWKKSLGRYISAGCETKFVRELYRGSQWAASLAAYDSETLIKYKNDQRKLWIISAGLGFISGNNVVPGYHAAFKYGECDIISNKNYFIKQNKKDVNRNWWNLLTQNGLLPNAVPPNSIHELVNTLSNSDEVLIAAGKDYYNAIYDDLNLIRISDNSPKIAIVGIKHSNVGFRPNMPGHLRPYISPYVNHDEYRNYLKTHFGSCNDIQCNLRAAQYLIDLYFRINPGQFRYDFP
jgi:hypothetical protein